MPFACRTFSGSSLLALSAREREKNFQILYLLQTQRKRRRNDRFLVSPAEKFSPYTLRERNFRGVLKHKAPPSSDGSKRDAE